MNEHAVKLQVKTLATAYRARTEWSLTEITDLLELKDSGFELADIATYLNRSYYAVSSMLHVVTSDKDAVAYARKLHTVATHAQSNQIKPACSSCWMIHPGDC
jgi:homoserine dehydrogenase